MCSINYERTEFRILFILKLKKYFPYVIWYNLVWTFYCVKIWTYVEEGGWIFKYLPQLELKMVIFSHFFSQALFKLTKKSIRKDSHEARWHQNSSNLSQSHSKDLSKWFFLFCSILLINALILFFILLFKSTL